MNFSSDPDEKLNFKLKVKKNVIYTEHGKQMQQSCDTH